MRRLPAIPALLASSLALLLTACGGAPTPGGTNPPDTELPTAGATVQGRVIVPIEFLPEELEYAELLDVTRVWLFDAAGQPLQGAALGSAGEFTLEEVPTGEEGYRLVAIFGSGDGALTMESLLAALHDDNATVTANITLESTVAAEIDRDAELQAAYEAELQTLHEAEAGEPLDPELLEPHDLYALAFDFSSVADPLGEAGIATAAAGGLILAGTGGIAPTATGEVCRWYVPLVNWGVDCKQVPDLVIYSQPSALEPKRELIRLSGSEIAKRVTVDDLQIYVEQVGDDQLQFSGVNGLIGNATGNVIAAGGGNVIGAGGYNLVAKGGASVIAAGGYNFTADPGYLLKAGEKGVFGPAGGRYSGFSFQSARLLGNNGADLIGNNSGNLLGNHTASLIGNATGNLIGQAGSNLRPRFSVQSTTAPADSPAAAAAAVAAADAAPLYTRPEHLQAPTLATPHTTIAAAGSISAALGSDGTVWTMGRNISRALGLGSDDPNLVRDTPVAVPGLGAIAALTTSQFGESVFAIAADGTLWAWGHNGSGQLGLGISGDAATGGSFYVNAPQQVAGLQRVSQVAAGGVRHALAIQDGTVWAWGEGGDGQLGQGDMTDHFEPVQVPGLSNVVAVAAGDKESLALLADGTVWTWGRDGSRSQYDTPTRITALSDIVAISLGSYGMHLALDSQGRVWAWGGVVSLFETPPADLSVPTLIPGLSDVVTLSAGGYAQFALFVKSDGTLWSLGDNTWGQLGIGSFEDKTTPTLVASVGDVVAVSAGHAHAVALQADGTLWAWGDGDSGQLGNGEVTAKAADPGSNVPMQVIGLQGSVRVPQ